MTTGGALLVLIEADETADGSRLYLGQMIFRSLGAGGACFAFEALAEKRRRPIALGICAFLGVSDSNCSRDGSPRSCTRRSARNRRSRRIQSALGCTRCSEVTWERYVIMLGSGHVFIHGWCAAMFFGRFVEQHHFRIVEQAAPQYGIFQPGDIRSSGEVFFDSIPSPSTARRHGFAV